ncbi:uncharacterized protein EDB93DRAFT_1164934 [Suillus bovinus]|uniref:uncharacterized protein n=1 Tax=Suillus bovinus TaxID=48563 RepID=UPI001B8808F9|nr:uncharacterized protein EDB93DRAFT_1164934 [Suillus bovinus]KAG2138600.1 hypothetical protein EDB93DRAFT_1164934 [Suillus bovinus]
MWFDRPPPRTPPHSEVLQPLSSCLIAQTFLSIRARSGGTIHRICISALYQTHLVSFALLSKHFALTVSRRSILTLMPQICRTLSIQLEVFVHIQRLGFAIHSCIMSCGVSFVVFPLSSKWERRRRHGNLFRTLVIQPVTHMLDPKTNRLDQLRTSPISHRPGLSASRKNALSVHESVKPSIGFEGNDKQIFRLPTRTTPCVGNRIKTESLGS